MTPPKETCLQITNPAGSPPFTVTPATIYHDTTSQIQIEIKNTTDHDITINKGECIARVIHQKMQVSDITIEHKKHTKEIITATSTPSRINTPSIVTHNTAVSHNIPYDANEIDRSQIYTLTTEIEMPYNIALSSDPMDNTIDINIPVTGTHETLGLIVNNNQDIGHRIQLIECKKSTPAAKIPKWRSMLKQAFITNIQGTPINSIQDIKTCIKNARKHQTKTVTCQFSTINKQAMHPQEGIPLLYHDQMNIISKHLEDIKLTDEEQREIHQKYYKAIEAKINVIKSTKKRAKLTRIFLKKQSDWHQWEAAEWKQLQQYEDQGMFSLPVEIPPDANSLPFIWTYVVKDDGTKKARAPCNGSPRMQGTVTLGETYAASLDQTAARIFWALSASKGHIVIGADASNAFAEAPAPLAPLYMKLDRQFHSWWKSKGRTKIPTNYGVRVHKAIQGHPESPRLWAILINSIITKLGFVACKHEPCMYYNSDYKGQQVYFLRQVDDFAISSIDATIANELINKIDKHMTIKVKPLGVIERFNGVDIA